MKKILTYYFENTISFIGLIFLLVFIIFLLSLIGETAALYGFYILAPLFLLTWLVSAFKGAFKT